MTELEKILEMVRLVHVNEGLSIEFDNDIHKGRVTVTQATDNVTWMFPIKWDSKTYSDTDPDCDGTLEQGIYYLKSITERQEA